MALPAGRYGVTKEQLRKIKRLPINTIGMITETKEGIAIIEDGAKASQLITAGRQFWHNGILYTATADIATTDTITPNTNCRVSDSVTGQIASLDAQKTDTSVIGTVEDGATASQPYSVGKHFIRGGQFKEVTNAIAQGEAITDSNTTNRPIADLFSITEVVASVDTDGSTLGFSIASNQKTRIYGKLAIFKIRFTVASEVTLTSAKHVIKTSTSPITDSIPIVSIYNRNAPYDLKTAFSGILTNDGDITFGSCTIPAGTYEACATYFIQ